MSDDYSMITFSEFRIVQMTVEGTFCTRESECKSSGSLVLRATVHEAKVANSEPFSRKAIYFVTIQSGGAKTFQVPIIV